MRGRRSSRFGLFASGAAQALAGEFDAMGVVNEAVQDGVGVSGVPDNLMPGGQRELGGDDRRSAAVSLLKDFEQIMTGAGVERFETEVVENEQIGSAGRTSPGGRWTGSPARPPSSDRPPGYHGSSIAIVVPTGSARARYISCSSQIFRG